MDIANIKVTANNIKNLKPSYVIRSFAEDVGAVRSTGVAMNMNTYGAKEEKLTGCLPCLGGMAVMNIGLELKRRMASDANTPEWQLAWSIAEFGDCIRRGHYKGIAFYIKHIWAIGDQDFCLTLSERLMQIGLRGFTGVIQGDELEALQAQVMIVAEACEKIGY